MSFSMIAYIEESLKDNKIIKKLNFSDKVYIKNYKNIFDKKFPSWKKEKAFIFAEIKDSCLIKVPESYWHEKFAYFFKNSLNCVFNCRYCFLKWAFKTNIPVFFLNYDDIKKEIKKALKNFNKKHILWFYSSDYSDNLAMNWFSYFVEEFVPFFETLKGVMLEMRTKSTNILPLMNLWFIPKNTEIAFSLNPQSIIEKYEKNTPNLDERLKAIQILLDKWFKVGLRFLPLLPIENYQKIYIDFIDYLSKKIDISKIYSTFSSGLLYTKEDYNIMLKKDPYFNLLYYLQEEDDGFVREKKEVRKFFYDLFLSFDKNCKICLDKKI